jgi:signal transduction histidine kinase/CheY-like chemotaxis protein
MNHHTASNEEQIQSLLTEANAVRINNLRQSISLATTALELSTETANNLMIAKSLLALSLFYMIQGDYEEAIARATKAATLFNELNDEKGIADAKYSIASVYYKSDNPHLGLKYLLDCLVIYHQYNDYTSQAKAYKSLGSIYENFGDVDKAIEVYELAITAALKVGDINLRTNVYNPLSGLYLNQQDIEKAMELIEESIKLKQQSGDVRGLAFAYYGRGKIYTKTKNYQLAEADFNKSIAIHSEMGEKLGLTMAYYKLGVLYAEEGKSQKAIEVLLQALELSRVYKTAMIKTRSSYKLYEIFKKENKLAESLHYLEIYHAEQEASIYNQTHQIINSYNMIQKMEAKAMEDKLQLERAEMMEKKNKAEYAAKNRQDFLSNMSHEIRTPLNAVTTITNLLQERADEEDRKLLESLKFSSNNLLMLVNDILDLAKLESSKIELEIRPDNLRNLLNNIKNTFENVAREKGVQLKLDIDSKISDLYELDGMKLSQILGNLLTNAIKFTDKGYVQLEVGLATDNKEESELQFKVADTGTGIPKEFLSEIFDSFTQPKSVTTKKHGGTGLGLAIVKKLTELYGSTISVSSELGKGSTFSFTLVLKKAGSQTIISAPKNHALPDGLNILVVEDNKINTLVITKLLSKWGVKPECAENGIAAVEKANLRKYDVILMDIHMPEMNGYDATKQIRQKDKTNFTTPIYALTADINASTEPEYAGFFNGFLRKPIEVDQLYQTLSAI